MAAQDPNAQLAELVTNWLSKSPRWVYEPNTNFFSGMCFMRKRLLALDDVQDQVEEWFRNQDASLMEPLKRLLNDLAWTTQNDKYREIYMRMDHILHSRLLRSRSDARNLTSEALQEILLRAQEIHKQTMTAATSPEKSGDVQDRKNSELLMDQVMRLIHKYRENDFLYDSYQSGRSALNAFKQQRSYISDILDFYDIPKQIKFIDEAEARNNYGSKVLSEKSYESLVAEKREDVYALDVSDKKNMAIALKQAYWFYHLSKKGTTPSLSTIIEIMETGELQNIGTKGHEWQAFAASTFDLNESLFETIRKLDKTGRTFEKKLYEHLFALHEKLRETKSEINVILSPGNQSKESDIELLPENIFFEIELEPEPGVIERISYVMPVYFRRLMEELLIDISREIRKRFSTKDFRIVLGFDESKEVKMIIDFTQDLGKRTTEIHKYVLEELRKMKVHLDLKAQVRR